MAEQIDVAERELARLDPILGKLIELQKPILHKPRADYFFSLCRSIIGQQVSVAAATTIFRRFEVETRVEPKNVMNLSESQIKKIGLSRQKAGYLRDLGAHFAGDPDVYTHLEKSSDEAVAEELIKIKGIGIWTAQMFLMFTLTRLDVFAPDDIGLQRAMQRLYGWNKSPTKQLLEKTADEWRPYRTVACWHLWKSLANEPV